MDDLGATPYVDHGPTPLVRRKVNGQAVASLVLAILILCGIGSVMALVLGYRAKRQIDESGGLQTGRGIAIAGIVLGWLGVALMVLAVINYVTAETQPGF